MKTKRKKKLKIILEKPGHGMDEGIFKCPKCGHEADLQNFDCIGADKDCVFCTCCHEELQL